METNKQTKFQIGMWHRPFEKNLDEVKRTLSELSDLGVTELFIETFFNGQLIYPSRVSLTPQHYFVGDYGIYGHDLLLAFIEEAKIFDIKIHAWVENFFVGRYEDIKACFWYNHHKDWLLVNRDQTYLQKNEVNYVFLDPANPHVKSYILNLYEEMLLNHNLASLHLDYIRYPLVNQITPPDISDDVGYTEIALNDFKEIYGVKGNVLTRLLEEDVYLKWCTYKMNLIDHFVFQVNEKAKKYHSVLSIAIFGDPSHAMKHKMQNWSKWIDESWIDIIIPMAYYQKSIRVYEEVKRVIEYVKGRATVYAGIAPAFMKLDILEHERQCEASYDAGSTGMIMFATQNYLSHHFMGDSQHDPELLKMLKKWKGKNI